MALEAASTFSAGVSPPFLVLKQEYQDPETPKTRTKPQQPTSVKKKKRR